jgi:hypothetical protein
MRLRRTSRSQNSMLRVRRKNERVWQDDGTFVIVDSREEGIMRSFFVVLAGIVFASCGGETTGLFGESGSSGSSSASSSGEVSSSSSSGAGGAPPSSSSSSGAGGEASSSSSSGGGAGGSGGSSSSSSSSSSASSSGCPLQCPAYQECTPDGMSCWGCTKNNVNCLFKIPKTQGVDCDDGYFPPQADCEYIGNQPEFPFRTLFCCVPK